jgi:hypothetical protein
VQYVPGTPPFTVPPFVKLTDQFGTVTATVGLPLLLCLPTQRTLPTGQTFPIVNPQTHLLCFAISPNPPVSLPRPVFDKNQFGIGTTTVQRTFSLCLPSTKKIG